MRGSVRGSGGKFLFCWLGLKYFSGFSSRVCCLAPSVANRTCRVVYYAGTRRITDFNPATRSADTYGKSVEVEALENMLHQVQRAAKQISQKLENEPPCLSANFAEDIESLIRQNVTLKNEAEKVAVDLLRLKDEVSRLRADSENNAASCKSLIRLSLFCFGSYAIPSSNMIPSHRRIAFNDRRRSEPPADGHDPRAQPAL